MRKYQYEYLSNRTKPLPPEQGILELDLYLPILPTRR